MTRNRIRPCEVNIIRASENRADIVKFRDILKGATDLSESHEKQFEEILEILDGVDHARMRLAWTKEKANVLFGLEQYQEAIVLYKDATEFILGEDAKFLALEAYNEGHKKALASRPHINIYLDLIFCFNRISEAYLQIQDRTNALYWLQDLEALYEYQGRFTSSNTNGKVEKFLELCTYCMEAAHRFVRIFTELDNTSAAAYYAYHCTTGIPKAFELSNSIPEISEISMKCNDGKFANLRHPDINAVDSQDVEDPDLQVRGIWTKFTTQITYGFRVQERCASWIWKSKLYVLILDEKEELNVVYSVWRLDLKCSVLQRKWRCLSKVRRFSPKPPNTLQLKAAVHDNNVWIFCGDEITLGFNSLTSAWGWASTIHPRWPYSGETLQNFSLEVMDGTMHVFGGRKGRDRLMPYFVSLKPAEQTWMARQMVGAFESAPACREASASWIVDDEKRFYIMFGSYTDGFKNLNKWPESESEYERLFTKTVFNELWSYSIDGDSWRKEIIRGNAPSPREHMSAVYHPGFKSVVAFGGSSNAPSTSGDKSIGEQILYGDTFIMDLASRRWRQVITRSFPSWRGCGELLVDDATGHIYMFGGCSNPKFEFTNPDKESFHADIWRLEIDLPGVQFNTTDFYRISPFFKVGSFRRCCACKTIGTGYFRCQGTCGGRLIFCSVPCQRKAWRTHRKLHGCQKF